MTEPKRCLFGCDKFGRWQSGMCPTCRTYIHRAESRPIAWRIARRETIERWGERLERTMPRQKVVPFRKVRRG